MAALKKELEYARSYAAEIAQGVSHYPHGEGEPCVRCERDRFRMALERISRGESAVPGLNSWFYGHAVQIVKEALGIQEARQEKK